MNANVHTAVGVATSTGMALLIPEMQDLKMIPIGIGFAVLGSILPDIDANGESKAKHIFKYLVIISILAVTFIYFYSKLTNVPLVTFKIEQLIGIVGFLICCIFGYVSDHRCYTHRLYGLLSFSFCIYYIFNFPLTYWFFFGFLSHQLIDMLNKRKILWLYPLQIDFSRYICNADSHLSNIIGFICTGLSILFIALIVLR